MSKIVIKIYNYLKMHKWLRRLILYSLFLCFGYFALQLSMEEDVAGFMPTDKDNKRVNYVYENIGITEKIIFKFSLTDDIDLDNKDELISAADSFVKSLDSTGIKQGYIKDIFCKVDQQQILELSEFITLNIPFYLEESDYEKIAKQINADSIKVILENNKKILISPAGMFMKNHIMADPLHFTNSSLLRLKDLQVSDRFKLFNDYVFSDDGNYLFVFISSAYSVSETDKNEQLVEIINSSIHDVLENYNVKITYFGAPAVAVSNAKRIKKDTYTSVIISIIIIMTILLWFFRNVKSVILIAIPVVFGALMSLAVLYLIKGTISAIAIGAGSVVFGIALNYSLHYLIHAKHEIESGNVLKDIASPMIVGSITTVCAFLSLLFICADAMRDFGLFAAFALTGTLIFVLIFLPHLNNKSKKNHKKRRIEFIDRMSGYHIEKSNWIIIGVIILTGVFLYFSFDVSFETEMNKINYMTQSEKEAFSELSDLTNLGEKSIYLVSDAKTLDEALVDYEMTQGKLDSLYNQGVISEISGIGNFLPSKKMQQEKIDRWREFWIVHRDTLKTLLLDEGVELGFTESAFKDFLDILYYDYEPKEVEYFLPAIESYIKDYLIVKEDRAMVITALHTMPKDVPLVSEKLTVENNFIFDSGSIAQSLVDTLSMDFNKVLYICSIIVFLFLTISFGRLELSLIAFLPMVISWVWILGIMSIFGIKFNIVNIILATFIFGLGDDYTIFMMEGVMSGYASSRKLLPSYKIAVFLSSVTMFVGIGTLIFAKHPAMRSLADVTIVGMFSVVLISFIIPPLLFNKITTKKGRKRQIPVTILNFSASVYSFIVFLFGTLYLTMIGFFLLTIGRKTKRNKFKYHKAICTFTKFVSRNIPKVKANVLNDSNEDFSKPGVIICNHQSHIDLMYMLMLTPKMVILTNDWVWNSPFYGKLVKYADFYPVANGIENSIEKLSKLVDDGYSIMVFPEGTRSEDCSILRFHRGAFYLAEKLNLDIIPVVIHGIGHILPKSEMLLRKGEITVKILDRISPENKDFGESYSKRTKFIRAFYKEEYNKIASKVENANYYRNQVIHNYIYKGPEIEWNARRLLNKFNNFEDLIALLPDKGKILISECGNGVFALMWKHINY